MSEAQKKFSCKFVLIFVALFSELRKQVKRMASFGLPVETAALGMVADGNRIVDFLLEKGDSDANPGYFNSLISALKGAISKLEIRELAYLSSDFIRQDMRARINSLHPVVYGQFWERLETRLDEWSSLAGSKKTSIAEIRQAVKNFDDIYARALSVDLSAAIAEDTRVRAASALERTLKPKRPAPAPARHKNHTTPTKGLKGQEPPKHGGHGTSKKVRSKNRKRRKAATA